MIKEIRILGSFPVRGVTFEDVNTDFSAQAVAVRFSWSPPDGDANAYKYRVIIHEIVGGPNEPDRFVSDSALILENEFQSVPLGIGTRYSYVIQSIRDNELPSMIIIIEDIIR